MKSIIILLIALASIYLTLSCKNMKPANDPINQTDTLTIRVGEERQLFKELTIKFVNFGHEHVSSSPDEAFAATVGVYFFELREKDTTESLTIYHGVEEKGNPVSWRDYQITILQVSDGQKMLKLEVKKTDSES